MINPNVVKAVQELLTDRGVEQREGERLADYVSRGLGLSEGDTAAFLERVHDGWSVEEAQKETGIRVEGGANAAAGHRPHHRNCAGAGRSLMFGPFDRGDSLLRTFDGFASDRHFGPAANE